MESCVQNAAILSALANTATALVAIVAAAVAIAGLHHQSRPYVIAEWHIPKHSSKIIEFVVRNTGKTAARKVKISLIDSDTSKEISTSDRVNQLLLNRYVRPVETLAPDQRMSNILHFEQGTWPENFTVKISYKRWWFMRYRDSFAIRGAEYKGHTYRKSSSDPDVLLKDIKESLAPSSYESVAKSLAKIAQALKQDLPEEEPRSILDPPLRAKPVKKGKSLRQQLRRFKERVSR